MAHTLQAEKNESSSEEYVSPIHLANQPVALIEQWVHLKKKVLLVKTINLINVTKQSNNNINHQFHPLYSLAISELLTCHSLILGDSTVQPIT